MIELKPNPDFTQESFLNYTFPFSCHASFYSVYEKLEKWTHRFPSVVDHTVFNDLSLLYLLNSKIFLDHRSSEHLFRLVLSLHVMQRKLLRATTFSSHLRSLKIRWIPTNLRFPFILKPVLGCLISFNLDRYEVFDEASIILTLQKYMPQLKLVRDSAYSHNSQHTNLRTFYFEIEKKDATSFSLQEQKNLKYNLEEEVKKSIQPPSPVYMGANQEETYKNMFLFHNAF